MVYCLLCVRRDGGSFYLAIVFASRRVIRPKERTGGIADCTELLEEGCLVAFCFLVGLGLEVFGLDGSIFLPCSLFGGSLDGTLF